MKMYVWRVRLLTGGVIFICLLIAFRLYQLQISKHQYYTQKGNEQYVHTVTEVFDRGSILFTTKDSEYIAGASILDGYVVAVNPQLISDPDSLYNNLKNYLKIDKETFLNRATLPNRTYVEVAQNVTEEEAKEIKNGDYAGVLLYKDRWRYYPGRDLSPRTVGFVAYDESNKIRGRYGLERYYDDVLARSDEELSVNFFAEIFSNLGTLVFDNTTKRQGDIVTTIEPTVSRLLQNSLRGVQDQWGSSLTGGIIINPQNGEIYAMDVFPTYDLNDRKDLSVEDFQNPLVENVYEFGSIIKALTVAAGLDSGVINSATTYYDSGSIELDTFTIRNFDGKGRGTVSMQEVLNQSLNTGVAHIVKLMGKNSFRRYFVDLKLGSETGIDLPNETHGLIDNLNSPRDVEYATASFGQGIAMTPIETVRALATLGNGGHLITPHLVKQINYVDGSIKEVKYPDGNQVFSESTSEEISRMLTEVVDKALRNGDVALPNYSVAAKTGTAQIADRVNGGYYEDRYLHSFFGYFPSYEPQFLVFLYTVEPKGVRYASETLTEPFIEITKFLINYYNVPPDR